MAVQGSGLGKGPDTGEFKDQTSYDARNGAAKRTQKSFEVHPGMKDGTDKGGIGPSDPGSGPVAVGPNPFDPLSSAERGGKSPELKASWDMKDANGKGVDNSIGGKVIGEAILSGSAKLPDSEKYSTSGPDRKPG